MTVSELIQILQTMPPQAEAIVMLLDGETAVPIVGIAQFAAAEKVLVHLNARISAAPPSAVPVFDGIADLHAAIAKASGGKAESCI